MRIVWIIVAILLFAAGAAIFNASRSHSVPAPGAGMEAVEAAAAESARRARQRQRDSEATVVDVQPIDAAAEMEALVADLLTSAAARRTSALAEPEVEDEDGEQLDLGMEVTLEGATIERGRIIRRADGTIRADGRYTIRGTGTERDPFRVSWDLLMSASETFQPRVGELAIPQRVAMLHGRHIRIEGYAAFPLASFDPTEMLMMLNQWDGCCIGVPPTPFDAIEVKLRAAPSERRAQVSYFGTVTGFFEVEPFLIDSWLVGLYLMDSAVVNLGL